MTLARIALVTLASALSGAALAAGGEPVPTGSLLARSLTEPATEHSLLRTSMFALAPQEPREFLRHDLIQIIVRESKRAESSHELETQKDFNMRGRIRAWPDLNLSDLVDLRLFAGRTTDLPEVRVDLSKEFQGEGDYKREDDLTARLTAEVIEILPNGNLVIEARTHIKTDEEESVITLTGICRPDDVTAANTVLSSQIHDLKIVNVNKGELKKTNEKGVVSKVIDFLFAF